MSYLNFIGSKRAEEDSLHNMATYEGEKNSKIC